MALPVDANCVPRQQLLLLSVLMRMMVTALVCAILTQINNEMLVMAIIPSTDYSTVH